MDNEWDTAAIFSPSAARQLQVQDSEWKYINEWLTQQYHPKPVPQIERNADTLAALLALVNASEATDEEKKLSRTLKSDFVKQHNSDINNAEHIPSEIKTSSNKEILKTLTSSLSKDATSSLDFMASTAVLLGTPPPITTLTLAKSITSSTLTHINLEQQLLSAQQTLAHLTATLTNLKTSLRTYHSQDFKSLPDQPEQIAYWTRTAKVLQQKALEYKDRYQSLEQSYNRKVASRPTVEYSIQAEKAIQSLREETEELETKVEGYKGLPSRKDLAELEMERARRELQELVMKRDQAYAETLNA